MTRPTISAILPTRNRPRLVVEAAASVLAQRLPPDELLVVEDGSAGEARRALWPLKSCASSIPSVPTPDRS